MDLEPESLFKIYEELQKSGIFLTSFIGQGKEGAVFEAKYGNEFVAVKCINKPV